MASTHKGEKRVNEYGYRSRQAAKHSHVRPKSRVRVVMHAGEIFTDVYLRAEGKVHYFKARGKIKSNLIQQVSYYSKSKEMQQKLDKR